MSLVSDALRKARQEAAERDGRPGAPRFPTAMVHPRRGSRLGLGLVLGAAITLLAAVAGGAAAWWLLGARDHAPAAAVVGGPDGARATTGDTGTAHVAAASDRPAARNETTTQPATVSPDQADVRRPPHVSPTAAASAQTRAVAPAQEPQDLTAPTEPVASAPKEPARTPAGQRSRGQVSTTGTREFVAEAELGRVTLSLDYIAYRPSDPFVQINGVELHEGSHIEGYTVERIGPDEVDLRDEHGGLVVLRVR